VADRTLDRISAPCSQASVSHGMALGELTLLPPVAVEMAFTAADLMVANADIDTGDQL
jgi:hypothetical protein